MFIPAGITMFESTDVEIDWHERIDSGGFERFFRIVIVQVSQEIPGGIDECVHGVRLAIGIGIAASEPIRSSGVGKTKMKIYLGHDVLTQS